MTNLKFLYLRLQNLLDMYSKISKRRKRLGFDWSEADDVAHDVRELVNQMLSMPHNVEAIEFIAPAVELSAQLVWVNENLNASLYFDGDFEHWGLEGEYLNRFIADMLGFSGMVSRYVDANSKMEYRIDALNDAYETLLNALNVEDAPFTTIVQRAYNLDPDEYAVSFCLKTGYVPVGYFSGEDDYGTKALNDFLWDYFDYLARLLADSERAFQRWHRRGNKLYKKEEEVSNAF